MAACMRDRRAAGRHCAAAGPRGPRSSRMVPSQRRFPRPSAPLSGISRRKLLAGTGASLGAAGLAALITNLPSVAQEQTGTSPATPNVLSGTPVPPEVTQYAGDWPVAQGNLKAT